MAGKYTEEEPYFMDLLRAILGADESQAIALLSSHPHLAKVSLRTNGTRGDAGTYFFEEIQHQLYLADTALHVAAAASNITIASALVENGADIGSVNRRGAPPLHYACDPGPMKRSWNPEAQEQVIAFLIKSGANPDQFDKSHVAALHRAVRSRSTAAVLSMLKGGACVRIRNGNGSTPLHLAVQNTGSSGSGSPESKAQQQCIIEVLLKFGADPKDRDAQGKSVREWIKEEWIRKLFSDPFF